jgi:opacity protein-like surface antigen
MSKRAWMALAAALAMAAAAQGQTVQPAPQRQAVQPAAQPAVQPAAQQPQQVAPSGGTERAYLVFPVEYTLDEGQEEGIYWPWGEKWPGLALGVKGGTVGLGPEVTFGISRVLNLRGGYNWASFTSKGKIEHVKYDLKFSMDNLPLMVDWHPFGGMFRISAGAYFQSDSYVKLDAQPNKSSKIGNHHYPADVVGTLKGRIDVEDDVSPYVGIGIGNAVMKDVALSLSLDIGLLFQSYDVKLTSNGAGMYSEYPFFRDDLERERKRVQDKADDWKIYPVVALSLAYHF